MNIKRACEIPGWMSEQELQWLSDRASEHRVIAEIGSWRGRSARVLADNTDGIVAAIDTWSDYGVGYAGWWTSTEDPQMYTRPNWLLHEFEQNLADHIASGKLTCYRMASLQAAAMFTRTQTMFDMIFIDADHSREAVVRDILAWRMLLKNGGLLCGHDFGQESCPEVKPAVVDLIPHIGVCDTIWWDEQPVRAANYAL